MTGPGAGRFNRDDFTMQVIGVSKAFPNPAKRRARATRAQADIGIARADEAVTAQDIRLATALAWVDLYYAKNYTPFLDLLILDKRELSRTGLRHREGLTRVAELAAENKPAEALEAFQRYFLGKLRDPVRYGLSPSDVSPHGQGVAGRWMFPGPLFHERPDIKAADALLEGRLGNAVIGKPDSVTSLPSAIDGVLRYRSTRPLGGFPLVAVVGLAESEQMAEFRAQRRAWLLGAGAGTASVLRLP